MKIDETIKSLDNSWSRKEVLYKLKKGTTSENIINEFLDNNKEDIEKLSNSFLPQHKELMTNLEELYSCEAKLINILNNLSTCKNIYQSKENQLANIPISNKPFTYELGLFMLKWSNKLVVITLLTISALALSKQAWA